MAFWALLLLLGFFPAHAEDAPAPRPLWHPQQFRQTHRDLESVWLERLSYLAKTMPSRPRIEKDVKEMFRDYESKGIFSPKGYQEYLIEVLVDWVQRLRDVRDSPPLRATFDAIKAGKRGCEDVDYFLLQAAKEEMQDQVKLYGARVVVDDSEPVNSPPEGTPAEEEFEKNRHKLERLIRADEKQGRLQSYWGHGGAAPEPGLGRVLPPPPMYGADPESFELAFGAVRGGERHLIVYDDSRDDHLSKGGVFKYEALLCRLRLLDEARVKDADIDVVNAKSVADLMDSFKKEEREKKPRILWFFGHAQPYQFWVGGKSLPLKDVLGKLRDACVDTVCNYGCCFTQNDDASEEELLARMKKGERLRLFAHQYLATDGDSNNHGPNPMCEKIFFKDGWRSGVVKLDYQKACQDIWTEIQEERKR